MDLDFCDAFIRFKSIAFPDVIERKRVDPIKILIITLFPRNAPGVIWARHMHV